MPVEPLSNRRQAKCPLQCVQLGQARCSQYTEDKRAQQDQSSYLSISCSYGNMRHMFALTIQTFCRCSIVKTKPCWRHMLVTIHHTIPQLLTSMYKVFFVQKYTYIYTELLIDTDMSHWMQIKFSLFMIRISREHNFIQSNIYLHSFLCKLNVYNILHYNIYCFIWSYSYCFRFKAMWIRNYHVEIC